MLNNDNLKSPFDSKNAMTKVSITFRSLSRYFLFWIMGPCQKRGKHFNHKNKIIWKISELDDNEYCFILFSNNFYWNICTCIFKCIIYQQQLLILLTLLDFQWIFMIKYFSNLKIKWVKFVPYCHLELGISLA